MKLMKRVWAVLLLLAASGQLYADEGMWVLKELNKQNLARMAELGFTPSYDQLYSETEPCVANAVVIFGGGCTGITVSNEGLIFTNHHCGFGAIQQLSSVEHDYLKDGFVSQSKQEELPVPGLTVRYLKETVDVSDRINSQIFGIEDEFQRLSAADSIGRVICDSVGNNEFLAADVVPFYSNNKYFLVVYDVYRDVRMVFAPPSSIGKFGGDTDNWMWPRHTADFSMFRIYTAPDGSPAEYSKDNVPLKPKHFLPVSAQGVKDGDFAMILGFPGSTDRYTTSYGLENTMDVTNDIRYQVRTVKLGVMREGMEKDPKTRIQYASKYASCANYWKYSFEQNKALKQLNTMGNKQAIEKQFEAWVEAEPARKAVYGSVLSDLKQGYADMKNYAVAMTYVQEALAGPEAHLFAYRSGGLIERLCDKGESSEEKAEIKEELQRMGKAFYKDFNSEVDANLFATLFKVYSDKVGVDLHPELIHWVNKKYKGDYARFAADLKKTSFFMDEASFNAFLEKPDCKKLDKDLAYRAGKSCFEMILKLGAYTRDIQEKIVKGDRLFVRGLMEMEPEKAWAPNANSTLRLTYGKVGSYKPRDAVFYDYYTTLNGVMEKEGPKGGEFEVPQRLKELYAKKDFAPYGTDYLNVNFITDNDITGGNSGSGVINAEGYLIGTAFDGNSEAMSGDIDFEENLQRCINLDTRYMLWIVDKYAGAKNLINEMTIIK